MAHILPDGWRELAVTGAAQREIETLALLESGLPDSYTVYHAVHWTNIERGYAVFGEIDFVVVNQAGNLLLIEQKSGFLDETAEGLIKHYGGKPKPVAVQMARSRDSLTTKLRQRNGCAGVQLDALLYCPDYKVKQPLTAGLAPERIIDANRRDRLVSEIRIILPEGREDSHSTAQAKALHQFLQDVIQLEPDVSALLGRARNLVTRVAGGLAYWARQLDMQPFRLRVTGTAGSGKTQLALTEYRAALAEGKKPLFVCFNRPLADHFSRIAPTTAPDGSLVCTFHMLCDQLLRHNGITPDFSQPDAFARLAAQAASLPVPEALRFDTLIVDEGQDFSAEWRDQLLRHTHVDSRMLWLEDPLQNLYDRPTVPLPGWVGLRADTNYRCPRPVVKLLNGLLPEGLYPRGIEAASPFAGHEVEILTYRDPTELLQQVKEAIRQCYSAGFRKNDLALLSYHGRESSHLMRHDRLGANTLRTFSGRYDLLGQPIYDEGDVLMESVYRFKGQSAPAVILAEIDFDTLDDKALRKLFVGATRAMMKLVLVIAEPSAAQLLARLEQAAP
jgi:hypothetical protein